MGIEGLENASYYFYNPIWVVVTDVNERMRLRLKHNGIQYDFNFDPFDQRIEFDLAKILRNILPTPANHTVFYLGQTIPGVYKVHLHFRAGANFEEFNRNFLIGGADEWKFNIVPQTDLGLTNYIWQGWPSWRSVYNGTSIKLQNWTSKVNPLNVLYPRHDCEHLFFVFRNMNGGMSYYLFEDFKFRDENKHLGHYTQDFRIKDSGTETNVSLIVNTKAIRELYETLRQLGKSSEIYYRTHDVDRYIRLTGTNNMEFDYKRKTTDVSMSFDVIINSNKAQ